MNQQRLAILVVRAIPIRMAPALAFHFPELGTGMRDRGRVMADPVMVAVAEALAGKAADMVAAGGRAAWDALVRLVRRRATDSPDAGRALTAAETVPHTAAGDGDVVRALAEALEALADTDAAFDRELRRLWEQAGGIAADRGGVVNQNTGTVYGAVIQTGQIHGDIHLGPPGPPPP